MWHVTNKNNRKVLEAYRLIIDDIFLLLIDLSKRRKQEGINVSDINLESIFSKRKGLNPRLLNIKRSKEDDFKTLLYKIIEIKPRVLEKEFEVYVEQNDSINSSDYNIKAVSHPVLLTKIFKDYFYDSFFSTKWIWTDMVACDFNRTIFKSSFKDENKLNICPYCDIDSISTSRNSYIEHFLPKSKFPYLSFNSNNLMPSCTACNVAGTGKGDQTKIPIRNPYQLQIGDEIEFDIKNNQIQLNSKQQDDSIDNFIELLKLKKKYNEQEVKESVFNVLKTNYGMFQMLSYNREFDEKLFFDFIQKIGRQKGFYFIQKSLLKYISDIVHE